MGHHSQLSIDERRGEIVQRDGIPVVPNDAEACAQACEFDAAGVRRLPAVLAVYLL